MLYLKILSKFSIINICVFCFCLSGGSRCLVLITVGLGVICVLLLVFIILLHITITAERDLIKSYKNTVEEFKQTINSLQDNYTDLTQKNLVLETKYKDLTTEKDQLQSNFSSLNQKKLELERNLCGPVFSERVWIGLSDREDEVCYCTLFWLNGEPNNQGGNEDCIELMPSNPVLNNWNDLPCSVERKWFCEK
uniref:C-type lectin domain-containing protein n=1 Tax=Cyprinus carpio TaxID=7962 RepID=A0A8C2ILA7_CYPCA